VLCRLFLQTGIFDHSTLKTVRFFTIGRFGDVDVTWQGSLFVDSLLPVLPATHVGNGDRGGGGSAPHRSRPTSARLGGEEEQFAWVSVPTGRA
jgi:hypothetical protein